MEAPVWWLNSASSSSNMQSINFHHQLTNQFQSISPSLKMLKADISSLSYHQWIELILPWFAWLLWVIYFPEDKISSNWWRTCCSITMPSFLTPNKIPWWLPDCAYSWVTTVIMSSKQIKLMDNWSISSKYFWTNSTSIAPNHGNSLFFTNPLMPLRIYSKMKNWSPKWKIYYHRCSLCYAWLWVNQHMTLTLRWLALNSNSMPL